MINNFLLGFYKGENFINIESNPKVVDKHPAVGYITPDNKSVSDFNVYKINLLESPGFSVSIK